MVSTRFRLMIPVITLTMAVIFSACGFKGDLYLPSKEEKKGPTPVSTDRQP